jgi:SAM-dependent methyltransferase
MTIGQYVQLFVLAIKRRGILTTLSIAWHELLFDWRYGTETRDYVETDALRVDSIHKRDGHRYGPLQIPFFMKVFGANGPIRDRTYYVDYGCGKGRTLMLAALVGFREIVGVEYSEELCNSARRNIAAFRARTGSTARFEVIHADAVDFDLPESGATQVCVFYDPFEPIVLEKIVTKIEASLRRAAREVYIVYFHCSESHQRVLSRFPLVTEHPAEQTAVYRTSP